MANLFPEKAFSEVIAGLHNLGYYRESALLVEGYGFPDYFTINKEKRTIPAAVFGQTPVSYETANIGVAYANGNCGKALVNQFRALGAPILLEIDKHEIREWAVSRKEDGHGLIERYPIEAIRQMFVNRASDWRPEPLLRAKNIGKFHWEQQFSLFSGLLPELEERIQASLEPLLENTLASTKKAYLESTGHNPNSADLFKLIFLILTAKVFYDRRVKGFASLAPNADEILSAIARQYKEPVQNLLNREARDVAVSFIWNELDFRNLSVEVLSQMWSSMLIDKETRRRLGIHRTSRTIVRYIVERIPFNQSGDDERIIFEPCTGSAAFLVGAMNALRPKLFLMSPPERHKYFIKHFVGIEKEPIGVEISRLALTLADFPNLGGWKITQGDVFREGVLTNYLRQAGVVLCNPPFADFELEEREQYKLRSPLKPVELLYRVLEDLHPSGVIGFVLPRIIIDGQGYKEIRKRLAERFANIDLTILPDRAFDADTESGLLVATEPIPHDNCRVVFSKVRDNEVAWRQFQLRHEVTSKHIVELSPEEAKERIYVPDLPDVWDYLIHYPQLGKVAELHRGIEWSLPLTVNGVETGNRAKLVKEEPEEGFMLGVAPQTRFNVFEVPRMFYLSRREREQRGNAFEYAWEKPKVILNKNARSRGHWRLAAFPDTEGVIAYQGFTGIWSTDSRYDEWILSAIINSPVANAFVATREGKTNITIETLKKIPVPHFTESQRERLRSFVKRYQEATKLPALMRNSDDDPEQLLKEIDALVLAGYRMPPRLERQLLDFFRGHYDRPASHEFGDYFPLDFEAYFSLSEYLSPEFAKKNIGDLLKHLEAQQR